MSGKYLAENVPTESLIDKDIVLTRGLGEDFKATFGTLLNDLKVNLIRPILKAQIGQIIINLNPKYKDVEIWNDGVFEYLLCNGQGINAEVNPDLHAIYGGIRPDFKNATIRHIPEDDTRTLGSYQEDSIKSHSHNMVHQHDVVLNDQWISYGGGNVRHTVATLESSDTYKTTKTKGGMDNTLSTGESETRMKNIAVQFYVIAKVLI